MAPVSGQEFSPTDKIYCGGTTARMGLFRTQRNWAAFFLRAALAAVFIPHGLDKLIVFEPLGYLGPAAWEARLAEVIPGRYVQYEVIRYLGQAIAFVEVAAGLSFVLGFLVRLFAFPLLCSIGLQLALFSAGNGYWIDHKMDGVLAPGFEYHMVLLLGCLGLLYSGGGSASLDKLIAGDPDYVDYDDEYDDDYEEEYYEPPPPPRRRGRRYVE